MKSPVFNFALHPLRTPVGFLTIVFCHLAVITTTGRAAADYFLELRGVDGESGALYEESTGLLTIALGLDQNQPEWKYVNVRRYASYFDGRFLKAADLNNDQRTDLILPLYAANKLLIIWGHTLQQTVIQPELLDVGPGPIAAAPAELTGNAPLELLVATAGSARIGVRGWDPILKQEVTGRSDYPFGFAQEGVLGFATAGTSAGAANPTLAILRRDAGSNGRPTLELFSRNPQPPYGPANTTHSSTQTITFTGLESGHPLGLTQAGWFMAWGEGLSQVAMVSSAGGAAQVHDLGSPITRAALHRGTHSGGANFLFADGSVRFYNFDPVSGFSLRQQLTPPPGESFFAVSVDGDTAITLSRGGGPYSAFNFQVNLNSGAGFAPVAQGIWPAPPAIGGQTTVALYTADPFGNSPLLIESFAAGDWAGGAVIAGNQINAVIETSGNSAAGLGSPTPQNLQPGIVPGVGAGALGNQWEASSSLFYAGSPLANGLAPVGISPPPGSFPNSIAVTFQPGAGVTVHFRVNLGSWQQGTGPVWLAQDTTIEFFGEHVGGTLSPIQSATYSIDQPPDADNDGDGIPDAIELLAGTDLTKGDSDGDGDSDFKELIDGSDPNDSTSRAGPHVKVFDSLTANVAWDDAASAVMPSGKQDLFSSDPLNPGHAPQLGTQVPGPVPSWEITLKRGYLNTDDLWFPAGYDVAGVGLFGPAMTALVGVQFPPVPDIPVDLNATDPVANWLAAAQAALDDFHAAAPEFTVGPASTLGALIIEYWYGTRLLELGRIASLAGRPRLADSPNSPYAGHFTAADVDAIQTPATIMQPAHQIAHTCQQLNTAIQTEPAFAPLRQAAEAAFAQATLAAQTDTPLDPPIDALRRFIGGDPVPVGYLFPIVQAAAINLRDQMLALVDPRPQVEITGEFAYQGYDVELETISGRYTLFKADGTPLRASSAGWLIPGATAEVRGFLLPGPSPAGIAGEIEVLAIQVNAVPEAGYDDLDDNDIPDAWQWMLLGRLDTPLSGDTDGDGYLDPEELGAGTDPTDPLAMPATPPATPREMRIEFTPGVGPSLVWDGSPVVEYEVWSRAELGAGEGWDPLLTPVIPNGPERRIAPINASQPQEFYQVLIRFPWLGQP